MTQGTESNTKLTEKRRLKDLPPTKVLIRRLPPTLTADSLLELISPLPNYDFFYFMKADLSLGPNAFSRAYINFPNYEDISNFRDKFDGYVFVDPKGNEYPAIVEFAAFQKVPKKKNKKPDAKKGTIEQDPDYLKFLESLENPETEPVVSIETYLEELEAKERESKATKGGPKITTPLIEYIKKRKEEKRNAILRAREEKKKREIERKQARDEERRKRRERESEKEKELRRQKDRDGQKNKEKDDKENSVKLLKNNEREDSKTDRDSDKIGDDKREKESADKPKDDKSKLRFSKENRERIKEQREEKRDERTKSSAAKTDRPRSGRDEWSGRDGDRGDKSRDERRTDRDRDRPRPKSYREEREQRRQNRDSDYYKDERPRSGPPRKDDRKYKDEPRDRVRSQAPRAESGRSDYRKSDTGRSERDKRNDKPAKTEMRTNKDSRDVGKAVGDSSRTEKDLEMSKDRDRPKTVSKGEKFKEGTPTDNQSDKKEEVSGEDKRRKRKERPERAIYDPRKALERRQGAKKESDQSPRDSPRDRDNGQERGGTPGPPV